jgi:hypothetical protein
LHVLELKEFEHDLQATEFFLPQKEDSLARRACIGRRVFISAAFDGVNINFQECATSKLARRAVFSALQCSRESMCYYIVTKQRND